MQKEQKITIISHRRRVTISVRDILYVHMRRKYADIHMNSGEVLETRMTYRELSELLGTAFIEVRRGCLVSAIAVYSITDTINLNNGEILDYTQSRKNEIDEKLYRQRKRVIRGFSTIGTPVSTAEYCEYYKGFEHMPFAFADIEMIFEDDFRAIDWVFRYGNPALARLEGMPLEKMIGHSFRSIFPDMDEKWLRGYERTILYGETLSMNEYSPEIDADLLIVCFLTFEGHCGCILLNQDDVLHIRSECEPDGVVKMLFGRS